MTVQKTTLLISALASWCAQAIYTVSPIDLIPDIIPILGLADLFHTQKKAPAVEKCGWKCYLECVKNQIWGRSTVKEVGDSRLALVEEILEKRFPRVAKKILQEVDKQLREIVDSKNEDGCDYE